ncbi:hypothetical protein NDU88_002958 [Pleurodeles waltl]|uniref:Uncharacterized protein n=1 Tax=Pleurodeles waltl TaxID=8319 RepID=A0AAV7LFL3_PLEWA|nr:hypothetical protein NDU88_002958 [Pleurodeles waltl]
MSRGVTAPAADPQPVTSPPDSHSRAAPHRRGYPSPRCPRLFSKSQGHLRPAKAPGGSHIRPATQPQAAPHYGPFPTGDPAATDRTGHPSPGCPFPVVWVWGVHGSAGVSQKVSVLGGHVGSKRPANARSSADAPHLERPPDRILVVRITESLAARWLRCTPRVHPTSARPQGLRKTARHGVDGGG